MRRKCTGTPAKWRAHHVYKGKQALYRLPAVPGQIPSARQNKTPIVRRCPAPFGTIIIAISQPRDFFSARRKIHEKINMSRNSSIDIAKGVGILLVVIGHNWILTHAPSVGERIIYSFHMPLFFLLGGVFLNPTQRFANFIHARADTLLKPYAVVLTLLGAYKVIIGATTPSQYFPGVLYGAGSTIEWGQMWFLPSLFITLLFCWTLLNLLREERYQSIGLIGIIVALFMLGAAATPTYRSLSSADSRLLSVIFASNTEIQGLPFSLDLLPISAAFLLLGYSFRMQIRQAKFQPRCIIAAMIIFTACHLVFDDQLDLNGRLYGNWLATPLRALTGIYIVLSLSTLITHYPAVARPLTYLGKASLFILIFHGYVEWAVFNKLASWSRYNKYFIAVTTLIGGIALPVILFEMSKRVAPMSRLLMHTGSHRQAISKAEAP
jgi:fucose 4-O-acetylase-like acetyltransferase